MLVAIANRTSVGGSNCFPNGSTWSEEDCCSNGGRADCFSIEKIEKGTSFAKCCRPSGWNGTDPGECFEGNKDIEAYCCGFFTGDGDGYAPCWGGIFQHSSCCHSAWIEHADPSLGAIRKRQDGLCSMNRTDSLACKSWGRASFFAELVAGQSLDGSPCVELGVQEGIFSREFLRKLSALSVQLGKPMPQYFMIDVWREAPAEEHYYDSANVANEVQVENLNVAVSNVKRYWNYTNILQMRTREAASFFANHSLAFVYVDARHDYCAVMEDLHLYWPKVKPGGIIGGDDYFSGHDYFSDYTLFRRHSVPGVCKDGTENVGGVKKAVKDFAQSESVILRVFDAPWMRQEEHPRPQWWEAKELARLSSSSNSSVSEQI